MLLRRLAVLVGVAAVLALLGTTIIALFSFEVDGPSMEDTFVTGDRLFTSPSFDPTAVERFDVVHLDPPSNLGPSVKRIIGLPGDHVRVVVSSRGEARVLVRPGGEGPWQVVRHDWRLDRPVRPCCTDAGLEANEARAATVPSGHVWVLGDNLDDSIDSREYGWIPLEALTGRVAWRLWPPERFGALDDAIRLEPVDRG